MALASSSISNSDRRGLASLHLAKAPVLALGLVFLIWLGWLAWTATPIGQVETMVGEVESARIVQDKLELRGWAVDAKAAKEATAIYVTVDGRLSAQSKPSEIRVDRPGPNNAPTGFHIVLDKALIAGQPRSIGVYAATDGRIRELSYSSGLGLPFGGTRRADRVTLLIDKAELSAMAVDSEYRRQAGSARNTGRTAVIAGASAEGAVDGYRQAARFGDPVAMAATPDCQTLFVIDSAIHAIRRVDVATGLVETIASYPPSSKFSLIAVADQGRFFVYDSAARRVVEYNGANARELPLLDAAAPLSWIAWANGQLFAIGSTRPVLMSSDGETWQVAIELPAGSRFDRFAVTGSDSVVLHSTTKAVWALYSLTSRSPLAPAVVGPVAQGIAPIGSTGRAIAYDGSTLFDVRLSAAAWAPPALLSLFNLEGKRIGPNATAPAYKSPVVDTVTSLAVSPDDHDFVILDKANHRIVRLGGNYWMAYDENKVWAVNSHRVIGPEYQATKPWGVNRMVWLSHSVYWDPAGEHAGNLAFSAPVRLERMLNADGPVRWEVLTANVSGSSFYSDAYATLNHILASYGVDYALLVLDLENFLWFLQYTGLSIPVIHDASGAPLGIDVSGLSQGMSQRSNPPAMAALRDYIMAAHGPGSAIPLMTSTMELGTLFASGNFMRAWSEDAILRKLTGTIFVNLIQHLNEICRQKGVHLIVAMAPSNNFVATNDWSDTYRMGGGERRYDVEVMHRPFVAQLREAGIDVLDLSYAVMARQPAAYPFDVANSFHHSHLFHQAVAEALHEELLGHGVISLLPQPKRTIEKTNVDDIAPRNKIFNYRDGLLIVLHDLWNGTPQEPALRNVSDQDFPRLLDLAIMDAKSYIEAHSISPKNARIDFVHVTAKDEYANMDVRSLRPVANMLIPIARIEHIKQMASAGKWDEIKRVVEYHRGSRGQ